jgi:hypothetical protein
MTFKCVTCFGEFKALRKNQKHCSEKCRKEKPLLYCVECDQLITEKRQKVYCSKKCHYLNKAKRNNPNYKPLVKLPESASCKQCQKQFKPKSSKSVYCSKVCSGESLKNKKHSEDVLLKRKQKDFEKFLDNLKTKQITFNYVEGYEHSESIVTLQCKHCLHLIKRNAQVARKNKKTRCENCVYEKEKHNREIKKRQINLKKLQMVLKKRIVYLERFEKKKKVLPCKNCGKGFTRDNLHRKTYCSDLCSKRYSNKKNAISRYKRLYRNGKVDHSITLEKLTNKYNGKCVLCNNKVILKKGYQHPLYPSIDHIVPVSKGGTHTWDNVQLAHRGCNTDKSNESIVKMEKGMLMLDL